MRILILVALFGAVGAVSRYLVSGLVQRWAGDFFPSGTLLVNVAGCFLLGVLAGLSTHATTSSVKTGLSAGFLGAFTTFSTFSFETVDHLEKGHWGVAFGNVGLNVALGLLAAWLGLFVAKLIAK